MIYILHIDPPLKHARHYVGWTKDDDVSRRVAEHLNQTGSRPSKLVGAALRAGCVVTLAGTLEGDRTTERKLKARGGAMSYCPLCRAKYNARSAARMRACRARKSRAGLSAGSALAGAKEALGQRAAPCPTGKVGVAGRTTMRS
jgi:hypothetical protein